MRKDLFMDPRELAMQRAQYRQQLRLEELDRMRNNEDAAVIIAPGKGCGHCLLVGQSVPSMACLNDCCLNPKTYAYLPIHLDHDNQRPSWCRGFEAREIDTTNEPTEQQELQLQEENHGDTTADHQVL
jgi:hypothetical protein